MTQPKKSTPKKKPTGPPSDGSFTWKCKNGKTISLPPISKINPDLDVLEAVIGDIDSPNGLVSIIAQRKFIRSSVSAAQGAAVDANIKKADEFNEMIAAWQGHSGVTVGESSAS